MPEKHGYEDWTVEQLRKELNDKYLLDTSQIKGKLNLVSKLLHLNEINKMEFTNMPITATLNDDGLPGGNIQDVILEETVDTVPEYGSDAWQEFLISQLSNKEKDGNYPKCSGLRRLAQKYLGDIVESGPIQVFAPTSQEGPGRATVVWRVIINWKINQPQYINIDSYNQDRREFSDVADCWIGNTPATFAVHPSSTAATRAEGRALKKALMLNLLTAEEMSNDKSAELIVEKQVEQLMGKKTEWSEEDSATGSQKNFVVKKCESMGIDVYKFINKSHFVYQEEPPKYKSLDEVSRGVAAAMIEELNKYQCESANPGESKSIPEQIKKLV